MSLRPFANSFIRLVPWLLMDSSVCCFDLARNRRIEVRRLPPMTLDTILRSWYFSAASTDCLYPVQKLRRHWIDKEFITLASVYDNFLVEGSPLDQSWEGWSIKLHVTNDTRCHEKKCNKVIIVMCSELYSYILCMVPTYVEYIIPINHTNIYIPKTIYGNNIFLLSTIII